MYFMLIGGVDIVLGAQWWATLGIVGLNLQEKFIISNENGEKYKLQGINCPHIIISSSTPFRKKSYRQSHQYKT